MIGFWSNNLFFTILYSLPVFLFLYFPLLHYLVKYFLVFHFIYLLDF